MFNFDLGKYRALTATIGLFLLLQGGLLVLDLVISREIRSAADFERLASRQLAVHLPAIRDSLLLLSGTTLSESQREERIKTLARATQSFDSTLKAFSAGGSTITKRDMEITIAAIDTPEAQALLPEASRLWSPLAQALNAFAQSGAAAQEAATTLVRFQEVHPQLRKLMSDLAIHMDEVAEQRANLLSQAKFATMALATLNFLAILYYLIVHLRRSDQELERARKETDDILRTTQEGLFLLDPQYMIGMQHSRALAGIIGTSQFAGANFFALLQPMVTDKTLATAREYLELLFKHDVKEKLVTDLNPLNCVQVIHDPGTGRQGTRYLEFGFNRVKEAGRITHLLVTVNNITHRVNLERALKETEDRTRTQMGMLIEIMQIEPAALNQFLRTTRDALQNMNALLQKQETGLEARGSKVHALFRQSHRVKGDAAALGMAGFGAAFERLEDTLTGMHAQHNLTGEDFLPVAVQVKSLYEQLEAIETVVAQISQVRGVVIVEPPRMPHNPAVEQLPFVQRWRDFAAEIALRQGNAVELTYSGMDIAGLPAELQDAVTTVINQFIRNAVVHGIEPPDERKRRGKPEAGRLAVYVTQRDDGGVDLSFRDDGRGISIEHIRQTAIAKERLTPAEAAAWAPRRIIGLIFEPGMSTRQSIDGDAGRGAGLDAVRDIIVRLRGNVRIGTTENEYCHFRVGFAAHTVAPTPGATPEGTAA